MMTEAEVVPYVWSIFTTLALIIVAWNLHSENKKKKMKEEENRLPTASEFELLKQKKTEEFLKSEFEWHYRKIQENCLRYGNLSFRLPGNHEVNARFFILVKERENLMKYLSFYHEKGWFTNHGFVEIDKNSKKIENFDLFLKSTPFEEKE